MQKEIRVGMIGYGQMGRIHTYAYRSIPLYYDGQPCKITLKCVCDANEALARKGVEQAGFESSTTDYRALVERQDIDVVNICTPNRLHKDAVIAALQNGKHVYCEKPLAFDEAEAREIVTVADQSGMKHQITAEYRFIPAIMKAKELINADFVGRVFHFRGLYLHAGYIDPKRPREWRLQKEVIGGGVLVDLGPHILDIMRYLVGEVEEVSVMMETFFKERPMPEDPKKMGKVEVEDAITALMKMSNGALGFAEMSRVATGAEDEMRFEIHGQNGALAFNLMQPNELLAFDTRESKGVQGFKRISTVQKYPAPAMMPAPKFTMGWVRSHIAAIYHFLDSVVHDRMPSPNFHDALKIHHLMESMYRSVETKSWVKI
ncbi:MAG: Gfo/Idh/MocA family oxidoreductase [Ignavibacteriales bacterium]|nr:Gfo/Idh/MocA family oxidoreductase [Ignavibacteriales bacterium]